MHAPRPSVRIVVLRRSHILTSAWLTLCATTLCVAAQGCGETTDVRDAAASRVDAPLLETGLAYFDAPAAASDALTIGDALSVRDGGSALCRGACDPIGGSGCAPGSCVLHDEEASCGTAARGARGTPCDDVSACAAGLACFVGDDGTGTCGRICCPGGTDCGSAEVCGGAGALIDGTRASWGQCLAPRSCRLLEMSACPDREACYVTGSAGEAECLVSGTAPVGERCALPNDCAPNLVCVGAIDRVCAQLCSLGGRDDVCGMGAMCVRQAYTPDGVGVCVAAAGRIP